MSNFDRKKLQLLTQELCERFLEREELIEGILVALLAKEHLLILGPPGTAKSLLAVTVCSCIEEAKYFQKLLTKFSTDKEIFIRDTIIEEINIDEKSKSIKFIPNTTGMLPDAHIAFLDEIFKCNSATLNSLLTLINERKFYTNDGRTISCPLQTLIGASNESPSLEEGLAALYDRFLLRYQIGYISDANNFMQMLKIGENACDHRVSLAEIKDFQNKAMNVVISDEILDDVITLRTQLEEQGIIASDRRYKKCIKLLKAKAFLHGRDEVKKEDVAILQYSLWSLKSESSIATSSRDILKTKKIILGIAAPLEKDAIDIYEQAKDIYEQAINVKGRGTKDLDKLLEYSEKIKTVDDEMSSLHENSKRHNSLTPSIEKYVKKVNQFKSKIANQIVD